MFHVEHPEDMLFSLFHVEHSSIPSGSWRSSLFHVEHLLRRLNRGGGIFPSCLMHFEKSHEEAFKRGGVPVFKRMSLKPSRSSDSERRFAAGRPSPPDALASCPMKMRPRRAVPLVTTTALAQNSPLLSVHTPEMEREFRVEPDIIGRLTTDDFTIDAIQQSQPSAVIRCASWVFRPSSSSFAGEIEPGFFSTTVWNGCLQLSAARC